MSSSSSPHTDLGPGLEFDRIRAMWSRLAGRLAPSGDDCGFVEIGGVQLAVSGDISVQGTHFLPGWLHPDELGYRAATAAFSDLAAVGAAPCGALVSVGISSEAPVDTLAEIMEGVAGAAEAVGGSVWGGDTVRSALLVLDAFVVGTLEREPVRRRGARSGDVVFVTGALGGPGAAIGAWLAGREPESTARRRFASPRARVHEGAWLAARGVSAMIDVSDGLVADAGHLAAASGVSCVIDLDAVPRLYDAIDPIDAVVSGEEYELLFTASPDVSPSIAALSEAFDTEVTRIGRIEDGDGVRVEHDGRVVDELPLFQQF